MNSRISIIAAIDEKRGLGKNNDLLFRIPGDLKRVREKTTGHPLIMGRKTFDSIHRPEGLPNRTNIVISRSNASVSNAVTRVNSLTEAIEVAKKSPGSVEIFIFGGGQIFKEAIESGVVDRIYLTLVKGDYGADTFFPEYSEFKKVLSKEEHEEGGYKFTFLDLEK